MNDDLPPDLPRLRTLETWAATYLTRIRARIAAVERQQVQQPLRQAPAEGRASVAARCRSGPGADTGLVSGGGRYRGSRHGDPAGWLLGRGRSLVPVSAERARAEMADGAQPCVVCRPDRVLNRSS
ncbi:DUF6233 domain-containing protein [Streptomyces rubiginosohelvolus]|uniref:DUF6233 domain-containing protein n=1 Tax=Streptomyces rubiginosohelvolus TaxID=67362 RepID=UPI0037FFF670